MVWWRGNDDIPENDKILALEGPLSWGLWTMAGIVSNRALTDGVLTPPRIDYAVLRSKITKGVPANKAAAVVEAAVKDLVRVRLWHSSATVGKCDDCTARLAEDGVQIAKGSYYIHQWWELQPSEVEVKKTSTKGRHNKRHKQLTNSNRSAQDLRDLLFDRDGRRCRYCARKTEETTNRPLSRTWDHPDPDGWNQPWNVVVCCNECNIKKADALPWEAGMVLLPPPYPNGAEGDADLIPDATYEGMNPAMVFDPVTGQPWGTPRPAHGLAHHHPEGTPEGDPELTHPSRVHASPERGGSGAAQGRPGGTPWGSQGAAHGAPHDEGATSTSPDGQQADLLQLRKQEVPL